VNRSGIRAGAGDTPAAGVSFVPNTSTLVSSGTSTVVAVPSALPIRMTITTAAGPGARNP
jgi:hypothetical protein